MKQSVLFTRTPRKLGRGKRPSLNSLAHPASELPAGSRVDTAAPAPSDYRYCLAKHDPAHCTVPGLFQPLSRGSRGERNHRVVHQYGDVTLEFSCFQPLGADDLRVLQGLLAMASPICEPIVISANTPTAPDHRKIRDSLNLTDPSLEILIVQGSCYQLAREIGLKSRGGNTFRRIRESLERLSKVAITAKYQDGSQHGYHLIGGYSTKQTDKSICIVLNPRLTAAVLGKRIDATGGYTRIEMDEVRQIRGEVTCVAHQYLCSIISPGETKELLAPTLRAHVWLQGPPPEKHQQDAYRKWLEKVKKQNQRIGKAMEELVSLGWRATKITDKRTNSKQKNYTKWQISRPAVYEALAELPVEPPLEGQPGKATPSQIAEESSGGPDQSSSSGISKETATVLPEPSIEEIVKKSPAKALREYADQLNEDQFATAVRKQPTTALKCCLDRLSSELFAAAVQHAPEAAMRYALEDLSDAQLAAAAGHAPAAALRFALSRLSPDQFVAAVTSNTAATAWPVGNREVSDPQLDAWFSSDPRSAIRHLETITGLQLPTFAELSRCFSNSPTRLRSCALAWPKDALENASNLPEETLNEVARNNPSMAIEYASKETCLIGDEILDECILAAPSAAIRHRFDELSTDQRKWCLRKSPWTAYALQGRKLTGTESAACLEAIHAGFAEKIELMIEECPTLFMHYHFALQQLTPEQFRRCDNAVSNEVRQMKPWGRGKRCSFSS